MEDIHTTMSEMKNILDEMISRLDIAEENISELEDVAIETIWNKTQRGKSFKKIKNPAVANVSQ